MSAWSVINIYMTGEGQEEFELDALEKEFDNIESHVCSVSIVEHGYVDISLTESALVTALRTGAFGNPKELMKNIDLAVIVQANDTTDSGLGVVYRPKIEQGDVTLEVVDEFEGFEGARANDVAGAIQQEYGYFPKITHFV